MFKNAVYFLIVIQVSSVFAGYSDYRQMDPSNWNIPPVPGAQPKVLRDARIIILESNKNQETTLERFEQSVSGFNWFAREIQGFQVVLEGVRIDCGKSVRCLIWLIHAGFIVDLRHANLDAGAMFDFAEYIEKLSSERRDPLQRKLLINLDHLGFCGSYSEYAKGSHVRAVLENSGLIL